MQGKVDILRRSYKIPAEYTDEQWQIDFTLLKSKVQQSKFRYMPTIPEGRFLPERPYYGKTQYQYYCDFINDILFQIRIGKTDYCFYIYQIADILKYEHDHLQALWLEQDRCFKLSLINKTE